MTVKEYQTVSIWIGQDDSFHVRGYYRACSYLLSKHDSLAEAVEAAFATPRRQDSVALVPKFEVRA
jgi:hypothetical protein